MKKIVTITAIAIVLTLIAPMVGIALFVNAAAQQMNDIATILGINDATSSEPSDTNCVSTYNNGVQQFTTTQLETGNNLLVEAANQDIVNGYSYALLLTIAAATGGLENPTQTDNDNNIHGPYGLDDTHGTTTDLTTTEGATTAIKPIITNIDLNSNPFDQLQTSLGTTTNLEDHYPTGVRLAQAVVTWNTTTSMLSTTWQTPTEEQILVATAEQEPQCGNTGWYDQDSAPIPVIGPGGQYGNPQHIAQDGWCGLKNGQIPHNLLSRMPDTNVVTGHRDKPGSYLRSDAAAAYLALSALYEQQFGTHLVGHGYRDLDGQKASWAAYGSRLAAVPGTSKHGWGVAWDFSGMGNTGGFGSQMYGWLRANGPKYGWHNPPWAQAGGSKPEYWHWEYTPVSEYQCT